MHECEGGDSRGWSEYSRVCAYELASHTLARVTLPVICTVLSCSNVYPPIFLCTVYLLLCCCTNTRKSSTASTRHITCALITRHTRVNPSLHAQICYLTCDLYCTCTRWHEALLLSTWPDVLFSVWFNNFDWTTGFSWSSNSNGEGSLTGTIRLRPFLVVFIQALKF